MSAENRLKVCLVTISLAKGGAERSTALLSRMLNEKGFDVHIVTLTNEITYAYSGTLFNLGKLKEDSDSLIKRLTRFQKLRKYFKTQNFDFIIDNRTREFPLKELYYLDYLYRNQKVIYVFRSGNLSNYLPNSEWVAKRMIKKSFKLVGVSKYIADELNLKYQTNKAVNIYNPLPDFIEIEKTFDHSYILFVGRIVDEVKNISLLLNAYANSVLPEKEIRLKIVGEGPDEKLLKQKAETLGISEKVDFIPFTAEVFPYYKNALFSVLTSYYEGFPRMIIESLSVGTPVVSVDCITGPNEIIISGKNGILVENQNVEELSKAFDKMVTDKDFYANCKANSKNSVLHLSFENISEAWKQILKK